MPAFFSNSSWARCSWIAVSVFAALLRSKAPLAASTAALKQALFDLVELVAFLDDVALLEQHLLQVALHAGANVDAAGGFDAADKITDVRDRLPLGIDRADGDCGRLRLLRGGGSGEHADKNCGNPHERMPARCQKRGRPSTEIGDCWQNTTVCSHEGTRLSAPLVDFNDHQLISWGLLRQIKSSAQKLA